MITKETPTEVEMQPAAGGRLTLGRDSDHRLRLATTGRVFMTASEARLLANELIKHSRAMTGDPAPGRGGRLGGVGRAAALTPEQRREIARNAARARWHPDR
jgi:hypothetical protein